MKLNEALPIAAEWEAPGASQHVINEIAEQAQPAPLPIRYFKYLKNGVGMMRLYCPTCGKEWTLDQKDTIRHPCTDIAICDNIYVANRKTPWLTYDTRTVYGAKDIKKDDAPVFVILDIRVDDGLIVFGEASGTYDFKSFADEDECLEAGNYDFLKGRWMPRAGRCFIFLAGYGFRAVKNGKMSTASSEATNKIVRDAKCARLAERELGCSGRQVAEFMDKHDIAYSDGVLKALADEHERIRKEKRPSRAGTKNKVLSDVLSYDPKPAPKEKLLESESEALFRTIDKIGEKKRDWMYCPACKKTHMIEYKGHSPSGFIRCEECGAITDIPYGETKYWYKRHIRLYDLTKGGNLVIRRYTVSSNLQPDGSVKREITETQRVFYTPKNLYLLVPNKDGVWETERISEIATNGKLLQDKAEIKAIIEKSTVRYAGLVQAWGLDGRCGIEPEGHVYYFKAYLKAPCLETLLAAGMDSLVGGLTHDPHVKNEFENPTGKTPCEILGVSKAVFKIARDKHLQLDQIRDVKHFHESCSSFTVQDWDMLMREHISESVVFDLMDIHGIPFQKIVEYLDGCFGYQCIERSEAVTLWRDYLKMATDMEYDLSDKSRKYPRSLKKEHDKASFAYRAVRAEVRSKRFAARAKENLWLNYENSEYMAYVPETPEEMVNEGVTQHHCLASYVEAVSNGRSQMLFIREKKEPETPFYAMEIRERKIVQTRGYCNRVPTEKKVLDFIYALAKDKGLKIAFR